MKTLNFVKYSGNGNDFVILDHPTTTPSKEVIQRLCNRHFGVGADGVLVLTSTGKADACMQIFNADGGEAEMCGNGLRCLVTYLDDKSVLKKDYYIIKTMNSTYVVVRHGATFALEMSEIKDINVFDLSSFQVFDKSFYVNTGVPHLAFHSKDVSSIDIKATAPFYRYNPIFPNGTNVSFIEVTNKNNQEVYVRTYERGVEDETHSCGTGLTAAALALSNWYGWKGEIKLQTKGGWQEVTLGEKILYSGEVTFCFKGEINL